MSQRRYEGSSLETVLAQVRDRFGDDVRIVEANRLRRGGVAGFFARERYELVIDDDRDESTGSPGPDGPGHPLPHDGWDWPEVAPGAAPAGPRPAGESPAERVLRLADEESGGGRAAGGLSTEKPDFTSLLESLTRQVGDPAPETEAPRVGADSWLLPGASRPPATSAEPGPSTASTGLRPTAAGIPVASPPPDVPTPPSPVPSGFALPATLARLGLPERYLPTTDGTAPEPTRWLLDLFERLPRPAELPRSRGSVVVVVGDEERAVELARELADELGLATDSLLHATSRTGTSWPPHRLIDDPELALDQRRSWRRRAAPTVVSVASAPGRRTEWARQVIDALEPTVVWATVEAASKPEDLTDWADRLGGIDALAVSGLDETVSPASVLATGIPVARLAGRSATPALWTALLAPRLAA